jgi:hypothetical protein
MDTTVSTRTGSGSARPGPFPAYGPVDAALGYWLFYVVVDRATPTVLDVFNDRVPDVSPSLVALGLAGLLWLVLGLTVLDQAKRQYVALTDRSDSSRPWMPTNLVPATYWVLVYGLLAALAGSTAVATFGAGVDATVTLIESVMTLEVGEILLLDVVTLVVFYLAFAVATYCLDRLTIRTLREILSA